MGDDLVLGADDRVGRDEAQHLAQVRPRRLVVPEGLARQQVQRRLVRDLAPEDGDDERRGTERRDRARDRRSETRRDRRDTREGEHAREGEERRDVRVVLPGELPDGLVRREEPRQEVRAAGEPAERVEEGQEREARRQGHHRATLLRMVEQDRERLGGVAERERQLLRGRPAGQAEREVVVKRWRAGERGHQHELDEDEVGERRADGRDADPPRAQREGEVDARGGEQERDVLLRRESERERRPVRPPPSGQREVQRPGDEERRDRRQMEVEGDGVLDPHEAEVGDRRGERDGRPEAPAREEIDGDGGGRGQDGLRDEQRLRPGVDPVERREERQDRSEVIAQDGDAEDAAPRRFEA